MKITDKVKSYEDVCKIKGIDPVQSLPFPDAKTGEEKSINGFTKIIRAIEVLNEGWKPDWKDHSQYKYYPWWYMGSASGFSYGDYNFDYSGSALGSRLVLKSSELSDHVAKYFIDDYRVFMVIEEE